MIRPILLATAVLFTGHAMATDATKAVFPDNEAVSTSSTGERLVQYMKPGDEHWPAPLYRDKPSAIARKVSDPAFDQPFTKLYMIEGPKELLECSDAVIDKSVCRPSTLGHTARLRYWIVMLKGQWVLCHKTALKKAPAHDGLICTSDFQRPTIMGTAQVKE